MTKPPLSVLSTNDLEQLASAIRSNHLPLPLSAAGLAHLGLGGTVEALEPLFGLGRGPLLAVFDGLLAERRGRSGKSLDLVWSGSDAGPSYARYTKVVVPELIGAARERITIAGYSFDTGTNLFAALAEATRDKAVTVRFFVDIEQTYARLRQGLAREKSRLAPIEAARSHSPVAFAKAVLGLFREVHWPFQERSPEIFYDPRTADARSFASLHAKCLIVDYEHVLITSANFTGRGQDRNIEVGVLVHDAGYAGALEQQWNNLIESGDVVSG